MQSAMTDGKDSAPRKSTSPARIMVLGFLAVILIGTALLQLPVSSRGGTSVPFMTALFTSTSAVCVTGLTVVDTALTWSVFGRVVILFLMQIGGLGFMSVTTVFFFVMSRKIGLSQRLLLVRSLNLNDIQGIVKLIRLVLLGTLLFEGIGAAVLWIRFMPEYGALKGLGMGIFHSVSAFCNAGFDLKGGIEPFSSLTGYSGDPVIIVTVIMLSFIGGLGFFVWQDIWRNRRFKDLHLHSKLVLAISFWLIVPVCVLFYLAERTNPGTIGGMSFPEAMMASLFQTVMPRSGGFSVVTQASLTGVSAMISIALMLIGGSAGSTAGGIKNVTAGILFLSAIRFVRGRKRLSVFKRTIPEPQIASALSITVMVFAACFAGSAAIALIQPELPFSRVVFETVSAVATCGLSQGITPSLVPASQFVIITLMFLGRVGIITFGIAAFLGRDTSEKTKHPDTWVMMG
ncbi:MAG: potassium uptake protein, TrkH family [Oscillospiraceae bacterium]|nr:potassium uptake protein, TrkH family [Oscillospiraceae bacterium]